MTSTRKANLLVAASLTSLAMGVAAPAYGQEAPTPAANQEARAPTTAAETTDQSSASDGEIVVTARRRDERLQDVPVAAAVVGEAQIRQFNITSVANIRVAVPTITLDRGFTGSATSISLRGVSSSAIDAGVEQSVLLDFDGMAMSRGRVLNDALFDIESFTVLRGPQAVFFGKNSPGGVVSIRSVNPGNTFSGFVRAGYEFTNDQAQIEAAAGGPIGGGFGVRVAVFGSDSQGYIRNQDNGVVDVVRSAASGSTFVPPAQDRLGAERKMAIRGTLTYEDGPFNANFKLLYSNYRGQSLQSFDEVMGCPNGLTHPTVVGTITDPNGDCRLNNRSSQGWLSPTIIAAWPQVNRYDNGRPYSSNNTLLPTLTLNYRGANINLTSVTGYYDYDYVSQGNADGTSYSYFWSYSNERNKSFYQELRASTSFHGPLNFSFGGHYENNHRTLYVGAAGGALPVDPATGRYNSNDNEQRNRSSAFSVFLQGTYNITPQLELAGGARYTRQHNELDSFNTYRHPLITSQLPVGVHITGSKTQDNVSPEATLTWRPSRGFTIYGAFKTGYLAGGYSNPGALSILANINNLSFDPETARGEEIGIKTTSMGGRLTANLTGYRYSYHGLPLTSLVALSANTLSFVTQNAANTISQGIEFESAYRVGNGLTLRATAAYNDAHFDEFPNAQCYTGQTLANGCLVGANNSRFQNLSDRTVYRAPKWIATAGVVQTFDLSRTLGATVNADVRYSSGYYSGLNLNPLSYQQGYLQLNAGVRISANDRYSLAIIGRNLTNRRYATLGIDKPGGIGEVFTVAGEPRVVELQLETRF